MYRHLQRPCDNPCTLHIHTSAPHASITNSLSPFRLARNPVHPSHQLQTIGFISYLWTNSSRDPGKYLVVAPLSTLGNWQREFARFCPDIPTVLYHGTDRVDIRATKMSGKGKELDFTGDLRNTFVSASVTEVQTVYRGCGSRWVVERSHGRLEEGDDVVLSAFRAT